MNNEEYTMEQVYSDCDLLTGGNDDGIKYESCGYCYRYDTCQKYFEQAVRKYKELHNIG